MLLGSLSISLLVDMLTNKCVIRASDGVIQSSKGSIRVDRFSFNAYHFLLNFEIQRDYQNDSKFNGVYSIKKYMKKRAYIIHLNKYKSLTTRWFAYYLRFLCGTYS